LAERPAQLFYKDYLCKKSYTGAWHFMPKKPGALNRRNLSIDENVGIQ